MDAPIKLTRRLLSIKDPIDKRSIVFKSPFTVVNDTPHGYITG